MVGKNDLGAKPDEPKAVSPEKPVIIQPEEGKIKKPFLIEPDEVKPGHAKPPEEGKMRKPLVIEPGEAKPGHAKPPEEGKMRKPLVIEPGEAKPVQVKPAMPELKGEPGKKTAGVKKPKKAVVQEQSRVVTLMLFLSLIFLAGGMAFLVLPIFNISLPEWTQPVMSFFRKLPLFPE